MTIILGTVLGGPEYGNRDLGEAANAVFAKFGISLAKSETGNEPRVAEEFSKISCIFTELFDEEDKKGVLNPVFFFHGTESKLTFSKPRTGKFSKKERTLLIQVPVPKIVTSPEKIGAYVFEQLRNILMMATDAFKRAKIPFDTERARELINQVEITYKES
jgi:hypothetical protein